MNLKNKEELDLEYSMKKIEEIIEKLENGEQGLKKNLELFKQGMKLCNECEDELKRLNLEVEYFDKENLWEIWRIKD